eukprot:3441205-Prorocentrum_lima.AAC.1
MENGFFPNQHVDIYSCIIAFFVLPTAHCTFQAALVRASTRANDHFQASPVQKAVVCGIGPAVIPRRR